MSNHVKYILLVSGLKSSCTRFHTCDGKVFWVALDVVHKSGISFSIPLLIPFLQVESN